MSDYDPYKDPLLLDHDADGIKELDNKLPRWWVWLFYLTIIFSFLYLLYYHVFAVGSLSIEDYERQMAEAREAVALAQQEAEDDNFVWAPVTDDDVLLARGQSLYNLHCAVCHGESGEGIVGPNLADEYWVHGNQYADTVRIIQNGVAAKGMVAWKAILNRDEIQSVASYIYTLRGTSPDNPKAPEGVRYAEN